MQFDPDNPKWTAYVLNELPESELPEVEQTLEQSAEARRYVEELRQTTAMLSSQLSGEPATGLTSVQRAAIFGAAPITNGVVERAAVELATVELAAPAPRTKRLQARHWYQAGAIALVTLVAVGLMLPDSQSTRESQRIAKVELPLPVDQPDEQDGDLSVFASSSESKKSTETAEGLSLRNPQPADPAEEGGKTIKYSVTKPVYETKQRDIAYTVNKPTYEKNKQSQNGQQAPRPLGTIAHPAAEDQLDKLQGRIKYQSNAPTSQSAAATDPQATVRHDVAALIGGEPPADESEYTVNLETRLSGEGLLTRLYSNTEAYDEVVDNSFLRATDNPLSTFSIDVDTASYSNIRRFLTQNQQLPPKGAVRIEEMINYFRYEYPQPIEGQPFSTHVEVAGCPWNAEHRLVKIGLKGREMKTDKRPKSNLVFLLDVSGSMNEPNKLPLVKEAMRMLTGQLTENDRVAIVVYAGASGLVLPSTVGSNKEAIIGSIDRLEAGGSTNGAQGIQLAYEIARQNLIKEGTNRVILATDGDFNVGITDRTQLIQLIQEEAKSGVFLTTVGFGMGNLKDGTLEQLANKGNGNYAYIDDTREARKIFVEEMSGTLVTIAKDVKIQIEFNPQQVEAFRLIGYENRILAHEDFNDDQKDAGEIGAGHTVTALYELVPKGKAVEAPATDPLKYQQKFTPTEAAGNGDLFTLKLRYKQPDGDTSKLIEHPVKDAGLQYGQASRDFRFAAGVALFGMLLRDSPHKGTASWDAAIELAQEGVGSDMEGYRIELVQLIRAAKQLAQPK